MFRPSECMRCVHVIMKFETCKTSNRLIQILTLNYLLESIKGVTCYMYFITYPNDKLH